MKRQRCAAKSNSGGDATRVTAGSVTVSGHHPVLAFVRDPAADLWVGREVVLRGRLGPSLDPGVDASLAVEARTRGGSAASWWVAAERVRRGVRQAVSHQAPGPRSVVPALVVALPAVGVGSGSPSPSAALPEQAAIAPRMQTNGRYLRMIFRVGLNRARALHRVMPALATSIT